MRGPDLCINRCNIANLQKIRTNNLVQGSIIMQRGAIKLLVVGKCQGYIVLKNGLEHFIFHVF